MRKFILLLLITSFSAFSAPPPPDGSGGLPPPPSGDRPKDIQIVWTNAPTCASQGELYSSFNLFQIASCFNGKSDHRGYTYSDCVYDGRLSISCRIPATNGFVHVLRFQKVTPTCEFGNHTDGTCRDACQYQKSIGGTRKLQWSGFIYGQVVSGGCYGSYDGVRCEILRKVPDITLCTDIVNGVPSHNTRCEGTFQFSGRQCYGGEEFYSETPPDNGNGNGNGSDSGGGSGSGSDGGTTDPDITPEPDDPDITPTDPEQPDVEDPDTTETTDTAVFEAIKGMNRDMNSSITNFHTDSNKNFAGLRNDVRDVRKSLVANTRAIQQQQKNDNQIYQGTKSAIHSARDVISESVDRSAQNIVDSHSELGISFGDDIADLGRDLESSFDELASSNFSGFEDVDAALTDIEDAIGDLADGPQTFVSASPDCRPESFTCAGNPYECFMARRAYLTSCLSGSESQQYDFSTDGEGQLLNDLNAQGDQLTSLMSDYAKANRADVLDAKETQDVSELFTSVDESNGFSFSESCPSPNRVDYGLGSFTISYQPFCDLALYVRAMLMLTASIASMLLVVKYS